VLLRAAPHIVWPMRFVLPHSPEQRPAWMVRIGLFLYDHLGGRQKLARSHALDLRSAPEGKPIRDEFPRGFVYSDCWVDDARLVVLNVLDAAARGATIRPRTAAVSARRVDGLWHIGLRGESGETETVTARILINAAGPWVADVMQGVAGLNTPAKVRLVKGSHIIVRKFWDGDQAYLLQNDDKRVIFVNPYETDLCLIGTTDIAYDGSADAVAIQPEERDYLLRAVNRTMKIGLTHTDIIGEFSGIRPLYDDNAANPSAVTRDYVFDIDHQDGQAPLLSVFGGKITTYRKLAEHALDKLKPFLNGADRAWTDQVPLPGGDMTDADFGRFERALAADYKCLSPELVRHYARLYGTRARELLGNVADLTALGLHFGGLFYQIEAEYLRRTEWARRADDFLLRRTKHGLHLSATERDGFVRWLDAA
jgi:glycerol-3-phosphate dehydrogenase